MLCTAIISCFLFIQTTSLVNGNVNLQEYRYVYRHSLSLTSPLTSTGVYTWYFWWHICLNLERLNVFQCNVFRFGTRSDLEHLNVFQIRCDVFQKCNRGRVLLWNTYRVLIWNTLTRSKKNMWTCFKSVTANVFQNVC